MTDSNDYSQFIEQAPKTEGLASLAQLATDLYLAEIAAAEAAELAKEAQQKVLNISQHRIPELMTELGMSEFTTTSGIKLKIAPSYRASIPKARRAEAHAWLDENNEGGMIKHNVMVGFARDSGDAAAMLMNELEDKGFNVRDEEKVESTTLRAWVKKQLEAGADIPMDLFGASKQDIAKITAKPETMFGE
tara:strand:+ start:1275 stop:1847 length:573 start_codon:yes stop_codon:yes gene_type:complete